MPETDSPIPRDILLGNNSEVTQQARELLQAWKLPFEERPAEGEVKPPTLRTYRGRELVGLPSITRYATYEELTHLI